MDLVQVFSSISQKVSGEKKTGGEFLAVKISSVEISAATWKVEEGKVALGRVAQAAVKNEKLAGLLEAADEAISLATESGENQDSGPDKVIFGLPFHWVVEGKIVEEKLALLRRLCKELGLKPLGFVLLSEALENYYKEIDGAPLTAILLEFDAAQGLLTMYRAGKNLGTVSLNAETEEINEELERALKKFTQAEVLPSRIIVYDGKGELEKVAEKITAFPWTKNLPFLHFPRVEVLPSDQVVKAIAVAGGMQMGGHFEVGSTVETTSQEEKRPETVAEEVKPDEEEKIELEEVSAEEAGFLPETEFKEMDIPLSKTPVLGRLQEMVTPSVEPNPAAPKINPRDALAATKQKILEVGKTLLTRTKRFSTVPKTFLALISSRSRAVPLVTLLLGIVLVLGGTVVYALPKVTVFLRVSSPSFDKELTVTVVTENSAKPATDSAKVINGSFIEVSEIGTKKGVATGRQLVGDKAKGSVTVYSASTAKTFTAGAAILSPAGLKFTLDRDVSLASGDAVTRATATDTITAAEIGDSYNLPAGTKFTIGNLSLSQYAAQADQSLSGGNSHEATVIAKEDQNRLIATLSSELTQKAKGDLEAKLSSGQKLLPNAITSTVSKKKFSKDIGNEADTVSLDLTMNFSGVIFSQNDLVSMFVRNFSSDIPAGFLLSPDRANVDIKDIKTDKAGNASLKVHLSSGLLPKINLDEVVKNISGKNLAAASSYLAKIPGVSGLTVETNPKILESVVKFALPWKKENIRVEVISE